MLKKAMFCIIVLCMMIPHVVYAGGQSTAQIKVFTDRNRSIVFESMDGTDRYELAVDQEGVQEFVYNEPGTYQYRIFEDRLADDRDAREYIATIFISVDEATGEFCNPVVAVDYADLSGKPEEVWFKTASDPVVPPEPGPNPPTPSDEPTTEDYPETHETYEPKEESSETKDETKKKKKKKTGSGTSKDNDSPKSGSGKNKKTSLIDTGDTPVVFLYVGLFVLTLVGLIFMIKRKHDEES